MQDQMQCTLGCCCDTRRLLLISSNELTADTLYVFSPSHQIGYSCQLITKFGSRGSDKGHFKQIYGLAVSKNGNIYVAEYGNKRVQVIYT